VFRNESGGGARSGLLVVGVVAAAAALLAGCAGDGADSGDDAGKDTAAQAGLTPEATSSPSPDDGKPADGMSASPLAANGKPLAGKVVVLDPGHNIGNAAHTAEINRLVDVGNAHKECDTTGTETNAGYPEAKYTLDMSHRVRDLLVARGATVKLTYDGDRPYGPCVDERARIGNEAHADAALSIHADGAPAADRGFHVIAPKSMHVGKADTRKIAGPSYTLATTLRAHFKAATGEPFADYLGGGKGMTVRDDLGGLNLSLVSKVFIECGNMRNALDAEELTDPAWRQHAALGIADGLTAFLEGKR
jgi:N-acetylmuramoyl-L-alanine amidase